MREEEVIMMMRGKEERKVGKRGRKTLRKGREEIMMMRGKE